MIVHEKDSLAVKGVQSKMDLGKWLALSEKQSVGPVPIRKEFCVLDET